VTGVAEGLAGRLQRALAAHRAGRLEEAAALYRSILEARRDHFDALHMLGVATHQQGQHGEALDLIDAALKLQARSAAALSNRGAVLLALKRYPDAIVTLERAVALAPDDAGAINNLGNALYGADRYAEALERFDRALALDPNYAHAHNNRGNALQKLGRHTQALASFDRAVALVPGYAQAWTNRGAPLQSLNRHGEAVEGYARALALTPDDADTHWGLALARLTLGDLRRGFAEFEWRWRTPDADPRRPRLPGPVWLGGDDVRGKTMLLHGEQGVGDSIQFVRYVPMVEALGAKVMLAVHHEIKSLLAGAFNVPVRADGEMLPPYDLRCPLLSLPLALGTELNTIPAEVPYLHAPPDRVGQWRARLAPRSGVRVGLAWSGNPTHKNDANRSIALAALAPLLAVPGVTFVSLQKDPRPADRDELARHAKIPDIGNELGDFADTAAVIEQLDLVITVDTAVAHLAGALGKSVWILLPFSPDWRWMLGRDDSPWYPTARLFRQPATGDWGSVVSRAVAELGGVVAGPFRDL
jgi:tetratricopeptide (TPR) repeat protein